MGDEPYSLAVNMLKCKHRMNLGLDDSVSFPAVYGANKVCCSF